jgi:molybdenum cofactor cytidylyltransferase
MSRTSAPADPRLAAVILAAGGSRRLGRPKQLLRYRGTTLVERAARLARGAAGSDVVVVIGDQPQRLRSLLRRHQRAGSAGRRLTIATNARWADGLATSLKTGIAALPATAGAALILLVDQAKIEAGDIGRLVSQWQRHPGRPAAACYLDRAGVPAVIPRRFFRELSTLTGDTGARQLLRRLGDDVALVDMPAAAFDIDTPDDVESLNRAAASRSLPASHN